MTERNEVTDEQLLNRIVAQDQDALSLLYERYGTPVYSMCMRALSNNQALAQEATQDTFMKVWHNPQAWQPSRGRFSSWLLTVARYTAIDLLRAEQRQVTDEATPIDDIHLVAGTGRPDDPLLRDGRLLRELIDRLPPEQAQVVTMGFFHGYTHSDLAKKLNVPLGTVKTRVRLGLQKLRQMWIEANQEAETRDIHP